MGQANSHAAQYRWLSEAIKSVLYPLLRPIDRLLQILVPTDRHKCCYTSFPDYSDNAFYIYRYLLRNRSNIRHVWLVVDMKIRERLIQAFARYTTEAGTTGNTLRVINRRSLAGYLHFLRSSHVFHTHGLYGFSDRAIRRSIVSLWHGVQIKRVGRLNLSAPTLFPAFGTTHISTSSFFKYIVAYAFNTKPESVLVTGHPRCDALRFSDEVDTPKEAIHQLLNLPKGNKLILWLPTFRTEVVNLPTIGAVRSFLDDTPRSLLAELDDACELAGCTALVKLHPSDLIKVDDCMLEYRNIRFLTALAWEKTGAQLYDLIAASDALITDVSSVLIDYLVTRRPIGILGFDEKSYARGLVFPVEWVHTSKWVSMLSDKTAISLFLKRVTEQSAGIDYSQDISMVFVEEQHEKSSKLIVDEVGL